MRSRRQLPEKARLLPELALATVLQVVRIVQESLNSALKHASARNINVLPSYDAGAHHLHVSVLDDGTGLPSPVVEGNGLRNLRGRASRLGAALRITGAAPGTRVELALPVGPSAPA